MILAQKRLGSSNITQKLFRNHDKNNNIKIYKSNNIEGILLLSFIIENIEENNTIIKYIEVNNTNSQENDLYQPVNKLVKKIIKLLNKKDLSSFIQSEEYQKMDNIPISMHRALSHINNPRLDEKDVILLIAYIENKMVGYLGALPDKIFYKTKLERMAWLSCLWIDGNFRGQKIAFKLVESALKNWENRILITEYTEPAKRLYEKTGQFKFLTIVLKDSIVESINLYSKSTEKEYNGIDFDSLSINKYKINISKKL